MTKTKKTTEKKRYKGMTGAQLFNQLLLDEGVETLFGYPGGVVLPIFDVLYDSPIQFVLTRHEQGAMHMADGYARSTGKVGVAIATSGPGATNCITGLATAMMDSVPMVLFTGQVKRALIGNDAFQEADVTGITRPVTKHNFLVKEPADFGRIVKEAFYIARTGRPGPVVVDIPVDITTAIMETEPNLEMQLPGYKPRGGAGNSKQVKVAADAINNAKRPVLYVGGGVIIAEAAEELRAVMDKGQLPATTTLMGLGAVDETHPLALHMLGMHGMAYANYAVQDCDCLIAVGSRFDDRVTGDLERFAPKVETIIHIDIDPASISKNVKVDIPVVGDAKDILSEMLGHIKDPGREQWLKQIAEWKEKYHLEKIYKDDGLVHPQEVVRLVGELSDHDAIVATGVGQHQMWTAQFYGFRKPRQIITSGGLGTMGFGVPAAIGAQFANPNKLVIDFDGDGSFTMTMIELITAVQYNQPVKFVLLDNDYLGMVRQWQELFYDRRYSSVDHACPEFCEVAEAFGATAIHVEKRSELEDAIKAMLATDGPCLLHVRVNKEENVFPMVAAGKALDEMNLGQMPS